MDDPEGPNKLSPEERGEKGRPSEEEIKQRAEYYSDMLSEGEPAAQNIVKGALSEIKAIIERDEDLIKITDNRVVELYSGWTKDDYDKLKSIISENFPTIQL